MACPSRVSSRTSFYERYWAQDGPRHFAIRFSHEVFLDVELRGEMRHVGGIAFRFLWPASITRSLDEIFDAVCKSGVYEGVTLNPLCVDSFLASEDVDLHAVHGGDWAWR